MNVEKPIDAFVPPLLKRFVARAPIHTYTYSKSIRTLKPYISFIYIDIDAVPIVTNIPLDRPDLYVLLIDTSRPFGMKDSDRGVSRQRFDDRPPNLQTFPNLSPTVFLDGMMPIGKQRVSLVIPLIRGDGPGMPIVQSLAFETQTGSIDTAISITGWKASQEAVFHFDIKHEAVSVAQHSLDDTPVQYTSAATGIEREYVGYNHSLANSEPGCSVYRVSTARPKSRMERCRRYTRANHIVSNRDKVEMLSCNPQHASEDMATEAKREKGPITDNS